MLHCGFADTKIRQSYPVSLAVRSLVARLAFERDDKPLCRPRFIGLLSAQLLLIESRVYAGAVLNSSALRNRLLAATMRIAEKSILRGLQGFGNFRISFTLLDIPGFATPAQGVTRRHSPTP
jgi:hypothetical protein